MSTALRCVVPLQRTPALQDHSRLWLDASSSRLTFRFTTSKRVLEIREGYLKASFLVSFLVRLGPRFSALRGMSAPVPVACVDFNTLIPLYIVVLLWMA